MKVRTSLFAATVLAAFALCAAGFAQSKRPMTVEDLWAVKRVGPPSLSPDNRWVAYALTTYSMDENRGTSDIWMVPFNGGKPRRLTTHPANDYSPSWNPGNPSQLAFISDRAGKPQIFTLSLEGGEAEQLTHVPTGVGSFVWAPDGQTLAFTTRVYADKSPEETARIDSVKEGSKVKARIITGLMFRHWNRWWDGKRSHVFILKLATGRLWDATPGDYDTPPIALGGARDVVFSPDGSELFFVRNTDPVVAISTNNDVFSVKVRPVAQPERLTTSKANDNSPCLSPDGRFLTYLAMSRPGFEADQLDLILVDRKTGLRRNLTADFDRDVDEYVWGPKSRKIYFTAGDQGRTKIYALDVRKGTIDLLVSDHSSSGLQITKDGKWLVFRQQSMQQPYEIFRVRTDGSRLQQLTHVNAALLSKLDLPAPEDFWFHSYDGTPVHGFLLKPPGFDPSRKYPMIFLIHGGPQGMWSDVFHFRWNSELFAAPGYVVAEINFRGSKGYGQKFCDAVSKNWGDGPYQDLMVGLDSLLARYPFIDKNRVAAAGASYGGFMINWIAGHTDRFKALVCHDGVFDQRMMYYTTEELWFPEWEFNGPPFENPTLYEKWSPSNFVGNFRTPTLVIHGEKDFRVPVTQGLAMFTALQRKGVPSRLLYFPDEDHFVQKPQNSRLWWHTVLDWIGTWVNKP